jgi:hypothetical protein
MRKAIKKQLSFGRQRLPNHRSVVGAYTSYGDQLRPDRHLLVIVEAVATTTRHDEKGNPPILIESSASSSPMSTLLMDGYDWI